MRPIAAWRAEHERLIEKKLNEPTLSILAMESGGGFSAPARSAIPATASARIEIRLVNGLDPVKQNALVVEHIRKQGYFVIDGREPTEVERLALQNLWEGIEMMAAIMTMAR